ncbi:hypothetical protein CALCODRAFT_482520 [Calocera cornea HHB12733]|uniref:Uncharacterized protein n=1 Tax=Calocera cornea HHB12733 TaxID=1353952 RepID=A0A165GMY5_9BASI|nr:hypothetical protein CALCODRAFT_482520 [Calocera cornea HHB12733]
MEGATVVFWISAFMDPVEWTLPTSTLFRPLTHGNIIRELSVTEAPRVQYYRRASCRWVDVKEGDCFELLEGSVLLLRSGQNIIYDVNGAEISLEYSDFVKVLNRFHEDAFLDCPSRDNEAGKPFLNKLLRTYGGGAKKGQPLSADDVNGSWTDAKRQQIDIAAQELQSDWIATQPTAPQKRKGSDSLHYASQKKKRRMSEWTDTEVIDLT